MTLIDPDDGKRNSQLIILPKRCVEAFTVDLFKRVSVYSLIGLPLLYASAYFLKPLGATGAYLLPSRDFLRLIILPTIVALPVGTVVVYATSVAARQWCSPRVAKGAAVLALSVLTLIGLKGVMVAAGFDWQDQLPRGRDMLTSLRLYKLITSCTVLLLVWKFRGDLTRLSRLLGSLGFAFGALALIRLLVLWNASQAIPATSPITAVSVSQLVQAHTVTQPDDSVNTEIRPRRVVWVIFDETDFGRVYAAEGSTQLNLTNFARLAHTSVFATNANSPASATMYSIPSLLTGVPISGVGIEIDKSASLSLEHQSEGPIPFEEATSIFGALRAVGRSASVLGFFHPYCKLFKLQRCNSFAWPDVGGLDAALWSNIPDSISAKLRHADNWESITQDSIQLLPQYLARDDALTFVHLNIPHLPASYADRVLHLPASSNPLTEYSRNLMLADRVLGEIVQDLQRQTSRHELLLVVSTDHWLRHRWYRANEPEVSRPIPFIVWRVGETKGFVLSQPLSTVHTAPMILDYLNGKISTQSDIAHWWINQPVYPSFIAPNS